MQSNYFSTTVAAAIALGMDISTDSMTQYSVPVRRKVTAAEIHKLRTKKKDRSANKQKRKQKHRKK